MPSQSRKRKSLWPWSRRQSKWDPPTPLDNLLDSPIKYLISILYHTFLYLRGPPFKPPRNKPPVRIVCISDTHSNILPIPHGDVLIHAGDLTNSGTAQDIQAQLDWIASLPHREKIVVAGNHDNFFDTKSRKKKDRNGNKQLQFRGVHYLVNKSVELRFKGGRKLNFFGCPGIPKIGTDDIHAFQYPLQSTYWHNRIPPQTDVLITHTPPSQHLDISLGCPSLLSALWASKPRLHVFGHIHSGHGREAVYWDRGQEAYERVCESITTSKTDTKTRTKSTEREAKEEDGEGKPAKIHNRWTGILPYTSNRGILETWVDVLSVVFYGIRGVLWDRLMIGPAGGNGALLVNAAVVWQSTTDVGNRPQVVEV